MSDQKDDAATDAKNATTFRDAWVVFESLVGLIEITVGMLVGTMRLIALIAAALLSSCS